MFSNLCYKFFKWNEVLITVCRNSVGDENDDADRTIACKSLSRPALYWSMSATRIPIPCRWTLYPWPRIAGAAGSCLPCPTSSTAKSPSDVICWVIEPTFGGVLEEYQVSLWFIHHHPDPSFVCMTWLRGSSNVIKPDGVIPSLFSLNSILSSSDQDSPTSWSLAILTLIYLLHFSFVTHFVLSTNLI